MDDVIGQGREPERDLRPPLPKGLRVAGWAVVAVAGLAVAGIGLRHEFGSTGAPGLGGASGSPGAVTAPAITGQAGAAADGSWTGTQPVQPVQTAPLPMPKGEAHMVICAPSTGVCSMLGDGHQLLMPGRGLRVVAIPVRSHKG